jgi:hypothetical protein
VAAAVPEELGDDVLAALDAIALVFVVAAAVE